MFSALLSIIDHPCWTIKKEAWARTEADPVMLVVEVRPFGLVRR
jgi:hypothetical protein